MIFALGGGWAMQNNGVSHFFAWSLFCGVSGANTTKQTWQTDNQEIHLFSNEVILSKV